jgi:hypothetical protein
MSKGDEYRKHADECRALARNVQNGEHRDQLLKMADAWETFMVEGERGNTLEVSTLESGDEEEAGRYRQRAENLRQIASETTYKLTRMTLIRVAEDYERRARARDSIAKWDKKIDRDI